MSGIAITKQSHLFAGAIPHRALAPASRIKDEQELRGLPPQGGLVAVEEVEGALAEPADLQEAIGQRF